MLLKSIVKKILQIRGVPNEIATQYGENKKVSTLAPFGCQVLDGLLRRPAFAGGETTTHLIARNAWMCATRGKHGSGLRQSKTSYRGYRKRRAAEQLFSQNASTSARISKGLMHGYRVSGNLN